MPIDFEEFSKLKVSRKPITTVNWDEVLEKLIDSGQCWSVDEVHEQFVHKAVTRYRVKRVLDKFCENGKLERRYDGKRFWYGPKVVKKHASKKGRVRKARKA